MIDRDKIKQMFGGRCAYCGNKLQKTFHIDHVKPIFRGVIQTNLSNRGGDTVDNMFPSCPRCNQWKSTMSIEQFRTEIQKKFEWLRKTSAGFRMAEDFGLIVDTGRSVEFYFEGGKPCGEGEG